MFDRESKSYRIKVLDEFVTALKIAEEKCGYMMEEFLLIISNN